MTKLWNNLNVSTQIMTLPDFKDQLKIEFKPKNIKHFSKGFKIVNTLLASIRLNRSDLNLHKLTIGFSETTKCQTLYNLVEHYIPNFFS